MSSNESLPRKELSNVSDTNSVGRFAEQAGKFEKRDSFDSAGMLREFNRIRSKIFIIYY